MYLKFFKIEEYLVYRNLCTLFGEANNIVQLGVIFI